MDWIVKAFRKHLPEYEKSRWSYSKENPKGYEMILRNSGFENIEIHVETANFVLPDAETWWQQMEQAAGNYLKQVSDSLKLEQFREQVLADLHQFQYPEGIRFSKTVLFAFGTRPR